MKRIKSLLFIILGLANGAFAGQVGFGLKGGVDFTNMGGDFFSVFGANSKIGFSGGLFFDFELDNDFSLQPEISFVQKGLKINDVYLTFPSPSGPFNYSYNIDYVEAPVLLKLNTNLCPSIDGNIFVGPFLSFLLDARNSFAGQNFPAFLNYAPYTNYVDFGLTLGAGLEIGKVMIDVRYDFGLTAVDQKNIMITNAGQNDSFCIQVGYRVQ